MASLGYYVLQKAIYEKLTGNSQLMAAVTGIFDNPTQGTAFPFITIGDVSSGDLSNLGKDVIEQQIYLHVWSREGGHKQASDIMEIIYGLLHNGTVTISGKTVVMMRFVTTKIQMESDGWTYHGIMHLKIILGSN